MNMLESGVDQESIQSAWENLETARHILQKRLDEGALGDEEKKAVLSKLAIIYSRMGDCECWQDKFKEAIEAYQHSLMLREEFEDPNTSRPIAETYFMIGNAMVYESVRPPGCSPIDYYLKAAKILENNLLEKYEKAGIEVIIDPSELVKKQLIVDRAADDAAIKDIKGILIELYQRIEDAKLEEKIKAEYEAVKKRQEEENKQALNAFGKPIEETGEKKVKNLGVFGKFGSLLGKSHASTEQKPAPTPQPGAMLEEPTQPKQEESKPEEQDEPEKKMTRVKLN